MEVLEKIDEQTLEVDIEQSNNLNQVFTTLSECGIHVLSMRNKSNRLEQLFMHLVEKNRNNKELADSLIQTVQETQAAE